MKGAQAAARVTWRGLAWLDACVNRLYGWRYNPLYQSGAIAIAMLVVMFVTGVYLLLFYRLSAPWASIVTLQEQVWAGRWIRAAHRYAADIGLVAVAIHAVRMFAERRSWGPRTLAWLTGVFLTLVFLVSGWTGYVMVWDVHGQVLAQEGARMLDLLPLFSEPIARAFVGEQPMPTAFFFLNLFAHVAVPVGLLLVLWLHVSRVARPGLLPPRRLLVVLLVLLFAVSVVLPAPLGPEGDAFRVPGRAPIDVFYSFWLPASVRVPAWWTFTFGFVVTVLALLVPRFTRLRTESKPSASVVDARSCTGCEQCYLDCPYEAIAMVPRTDGRKTLLAAIDESLCVSCGICAGSCAPMGVGPPGRAGKDQMAEVRSFVASSPPDPSRAVLVGCIHGGAPGPDFEGTPVLRVGCAGSLHTSVIEFLVRSGAGGVMVVACPERDCWNREGPKWLEQRMYHDREAELQERVDRARVRLVHAARAEAGVVRRALGEFNEAIDRLSRADAEERIDLVALCERDETEVGA